MPKEIFEVVKERFHLSDKTQYIIQGHWPKEATMEVYLDNKKLKETFGAKARMLSSDEVVTWTGHPVGGVCPFGLENPLAVYCDVSLRHYQEVLPAAGAIHSAVRIEPERMAQLTDATWVDVCL